ncbi:MAG: hypothetical protein FWF01_01180 [Alphaproteobacteria bacterium]|nr:hypothetical protein [Alphaproteobacteria bacterium]
MTGKKPGLTSQQEAWRVGGYLLVTLVSIASLYILLPLTSMFRGNSFSQAKELSFMLVRDPAFLARQYLAWTKLFFNNTSQFHMWIPLFHVLIFFIGRMYVFTTGPFAEKAVPDMTDAADEQQPQQPSGPKVYSHWARMGDIKYMGLSGERDKARWGWLGSAFHTVLSLPKNMFVIGLGRMENLIIPTLLCEKRRHAVVAASKYIEEATSGTRALSGPVMRFDDMLVGNVNPSFNPISPENMPQSDDGKHRYLSFIADCLLKPESPENDLVRDALVGILWLFFDKCSQARANDYFLMRVTRDAMDEEDYRVLQTYYACMPDSPQKLRAKQHMFLKTMDLKHYMPIGTWASVPYFLRPKVAGLPMALVSMTELQLKAINDSKVSGKQDDIFGLVLEYLQAETWLFAYNPRIWQLLSPLTEITARKRSFVMAMLFEALQAFKSDSVARAFSGNDLKYGMLVDGTRPVTLYIQPDNFKMAGFMAKLLAHNCAASKNIMLVIEDARMGKDLMPLADIASCAVVGAKKLSSLPEELLQKASYMVVNRLDDQEGAQAIAEKIPLKKVPRALRFNIFTATLLLPLYIYRKIKCKCKAELISQEDLLAMDKNVQLIFNSARMSVPIAADPDYRRFFPNAGRYMPVNKVSADVVAARPKEDQNQ